MAAILAAPTTMSRAQGELLIQLNSVDDHQLDSQFDSSDTFPEPRELFATSPPDPPSNPPPDGRREPGGSLSGNEDQSCPPHSMPLTAITPPNAQGLTLSEQPTFWFYIPYAPDDVQIGEFSILTRDETQDVYRTFFHLPETPGLVSLQLPDSEDIHLQEDQYYHWYLKLYCGESNDVPDLNTIASVAPDLTINGWVKRVAPTPERESQILNGFPDIWYDTVAHLAEQRQASPPTIENLEEQWAELLAYGELENFVEEPLVGSVLMLDTRGVSQNNR